MFAARSSVGQADEHRTRDDSLHEGPRKDVWTSRGERVGRLLGGDGTRAGLGPNGISTLRELILERPPAPRSGGRPPAGCDAARRSRRRCRWSPQQASKRCSVSIEKCRVKVSYGRRKRFSRLFVVASNCGQGPHGAKIHEEERSRSGSPDESWEGRAARAVDARWCRTGQVNIASRRWDKAPDRQTRSVSAPTPDAGLGRER